MIGILGGYGKVGLQTARVIRRWEKFHLRIGGRNPEKVPKEIVNEFPDAEWVKVDIGNDDSLKKFIKNCDLIINCAGPSYRITARIAKMCLSYGCHHVDAGEGKDIEKLYETTPKAAVIYGAGAIPGLSGLLLRWFADSFDNVTNLIAYTGGLDQFTLSGAEDYLFGIFDGDREPLSTWRDGACRLAAASRRAGVILPFFPREVTLQPYFDAETEFIAKSLALQNGEWYMAVDGDHMSAALEEIPAQFYTDSKSAVESLCLATELDTAGRQTYLNYLFQMEGYKQGQPLTCTLVVRAESATILTGSVAAAAGIALLEGELPVNAGPVASIPNPETIISRLSDIQAISQLKIYDCSIKNFLQIAEGEI